MYDVHYHRMEYGEKDSGRSKQVRKKRHSVFQTEDFLVPFNPHEERYYQSSVHLNPMVKRRSNRSQSEAVLFQPSHDKNMSFENPIATNAYTENISVISSETSNEIKGILSHEPIHCADGCPCQSREGYVGKHITVTIQEANEDNSEKIIDDSGTTSWQILRRKILIDLERHFGKKVEHDRLISCLCKYLKDLDIEIF